MAYRRLHDEESRWGGYDRLADVFAANLQTKRVIDEPRLKLETCRRELLKVEAERRDLCGSTYQSPELDNLTGRIVALLIDDAEVNRAMILHADGPNKGAAICEATLAGRLDVRASEEDVREAIAKVRRDTRRVKEAGPAKIRLADDPLDACIGSPPSGAATLPARRLRTLSLFARNLSRPRCESLRRMRLSRRGGSDRSITTPALPKIRLMNAKW